MNPKKFTLDNCAYNSRKEPLEFYTFQLPAGKYDLNLSFDGHYYGFLYLKQKATLVKAPFGYETESEFLHTKCQVYTSIVVSESSNSTPISVIVQGASDHNTCAVSNVVIEISDHTPPKEIPWSEIKVMAKIEI